MLVRYLLALALTLVIEGCIAYLLGLGEPRYLLVISLINVVTNLILNYFLLVLGYFGMDLDLATIFLLEILVVVVEWRLLVYAFGSARRRFLVQSVLGNTMSFLAGVLLFWI